MKPILTYPLTDPQVVFDYVWHHFIIEKNPRAISVSGDNCVYDTPSGGCAVGCVLPPDLRAQIGKTQFSIFHLARNYDSFSATINENIIPFLDDLKAVIPKSLTSLMEHLQVAHDGNSSLEGMEQSFRSIAASLKLTIPTP